VKPLTVNVLFARRREPSVWRSPAHIVRARLLAARRCSADVCDHLFRRFRSPARSSV